MDQSILNNYIFSEAPEVDNNLWQYLNNERARYATLSRFNSLEKMLVDNVSYFNELFPKYQIEKVQPELRIFRIYLGITWQLTESRIVYYSSLKKGDAQSRGQYDKQLKELRKFLKNCTFDDLMEIQLVTPKETVKISNKLLLSWIQHFIDVDSFRKGYLGLTLLLGEKEERGIYEKERQVNSIFKQFVETELFSLYQFLFNQTGLNKADTIRAILTVTYSIGLNWSALITQKPFDYLKTTFKNLHHPKQ